MGICLTKDQNFRIFPKNVLERNPAGIDRQLFRHFSTQPLRKCHKRRSFKLCPKRGLTHYPLCLENKFATGGEGADPFMANMAKPGGQRWRLRWIRSFRNSPNAN